MLYYISVLLGFEKYGTMTILLALVLLMFVYVFTYPKYEADQIMATFFGVVYVAVMLSFILLTGNRGKWQVYCLADLPLFPGAVIPVPIAWECSLANTKWHRYCVQRNP